MNIPIGKAEEEHTRFFESSPSDKIKQLLQSDFNGYLVATIEGVTGLEEGLLMLKNKEVVGAIFDALRINKQLFGVPALRSVLNLLKAKKGNFDVNSLSGQQVDLILAFNEKIKLTRPINLQTLSKLEPNEYQPGFVSKELAVSMQVTDTKSHLLRKLGLGSI